MKIATWNLCLGLANKKDYVINTIRNERIDICGLQEIEINKDFPKQNLSAKGYKFESESNDIKARVGLYINTNIVYDRRKDLEGINNSLIIIDFNAQNKNFRLINLYRVFNPQNGRSAFVNFETQLQKINEAIINDQTRKIIIMGDFNLDDSKKFNVNYAQRNFFEILNEIFDNHGLQQLINFPTWERLVGNVIKQSVLDHIYVKDYTLITEINSIKPNIGDHLLVTFIIASTTPIPKFTQKRCWQSYSKTKLNEALSRIDFSCDAISVQSLWNIFENKLINVIDNLVPIVNFNKNVTVKSEKPTPIIKNKINLRNRLLKRLKITKDHETKSRVKNLNIEIKSHFAQLKRKKVRLGLIPGNSKSLWTSVKIAKDLNIQSIPSKLFHANVIVDETEVPDAFASFFKNKIVNLVNESRINCNVYNGSCKVAAEEKNFMSEANVMEAIKSLTIKNCEGYDRIPQRILIDGISHLLRPLSQIFDKIYRTKLIPEQWLVAKVIPIFKKGNPNQIENYRPIANLCSTSKIFEKLILQRLHQIEIQNLIDLTNRSQHGFKKNHSTNSAALVLQSVLARALDGGNIALMASLDLSAAFDLVNVELLLLRLRRIGLPDDVISLVGNWLSLRYYYVSVDGRSSIIHELNVGTVQGSILGPILYAIFVSPLFDLAKMTKFADDNFVIKYNKSMSQLIDDMKKTLEMIIKWLKDSGLKVNDDKTELCMFNRADAPSIQISINGSQITSKLTINVLGVIFDSKLQWGAQVENVIKKSNKAKHAILLIRKYFNKAELNTLLTANYYSLLYYNCDVWLIPSLKPQLKQQLLSASARALRICTPDYNSLMSFEQIHSVNKRATPKQMMIYKHALLLFKIWNDPIYSKDWLALNFQQNFSARSSHVRVFDTSNVKIGKNLTVNRLKLINGLIEYKWLNMKPDTYKIKCKSQFLFA